MTLCKHAIAVAGSTQAGVPNTETTIVEKDGEQYLCTPETCKIGKKNCQPEAKEK